METLYVWLFIFAGAAIVLLGIFLLTSERELKNQRRECERLRANQQTANAIAPLIEPQHTETQSVELMTKNRELLEKISSLTKQLEESRRTVDKLHVEERKLATIQSENQQLQQSIGDLRNQLQTSETRLSELLRQNQDAAQRNSKLQTEVPELEQQLRASQKMIAELRKGEQRLLDAESENQKLRAESQALQREIVNLRNQLQRSDDQYQEVAEREPKLQSDLAESRQHSESMRVKNKELLEQINAVSSKLAESQRTVEELQTIQDGTSSENRRLLAANQELQKEIANLTQRLQGSEARLAESLGRDQEAADGQAPLQTKIADLTPQLKESQAEQSGTQIHNANKKEAKPAVQASGRLKWRFGMVPAIVVLTTITGGGAVVFLASTKFSGSEEVAVAPQTFADEASNPPEASSVTTKKSGPARVVGLRENEIPRQTMGTKPAPRLQGTFKITRPTQVYSRPSEHSSLIANVGPGMKINVVDSRDGWLEVRSKHGRPPGFIRQEAAVRSDQN